MERSNGTKKGLRTAAVGFFLFAALLSTGCDALMNPVADKSSAQGPSTALNSGQPHNPAGQPHNP